MRKYDSIQVNATVETGRLALLTKKPKGGWAPSSSSKAFKEEEVEACFAGAKAAAVAIREARMAVFILILVIDRK